MSDVEFAGEAEIIEIAEAAESRARIEHEVLRDAFSQVFTAPNGAIVLTDLVRRARVYRPLADDNERLDAMELARREGHREFVLYIIKRVVENVPNLEIKP